MKDKFEIKTDWIEISRIGEKFIAIQGDRKWSMVGNVSEVVGCESIDARVEFIQTVLGIIEMEGYA